MTEGYSKFRKTFKMMRHIENLGIVKTVYSGIFGNIQGYLAIFSHGQVY